MSGLREALEKLVQGWQYVGEPVDMTRTDSVTDDCADELKRVLTAHPAEPAPVASRERVAEVATRAILYNLPIDAFGDGKRLEEYAALWGNAAAMAALAAGVFRDEATVKAEVLPSLADLADMLRETFTAEPGGVTWEQAAESVLILMAGAS